MFNPFKAIEIKRCECGGEVECKAWYNTCKCGKVIEGDLPMLPGNATDSDFDDWGFSNGSK